MRISNLFETMIVLTALGLASCAPSSGSLRVNGEALGPGNGGLSVNDTFGSCDTRTIPGPDQGQCREWSSPAGNYDLGVSCQGMGGMYSTHACDHTLLIGTCVTPMVMGITTAYYYYSFAYNAGQALTDCSLMNGSFTAN